MELNYLALPGALLALIGVIAIFMKIGRKDQKLTDLDTKSSEHDKLLQDCSNKKLVSAEDCAKTQGACVAQQKDANERVLREISDLKRQVQQNRSDLFKEIKEDREAVHKELMKLNGVVGEINGLVGRLRFDGDGRVR